MSSCDCDLEYSEFENTYAPKARKIHFCQECQNDIFPGQTYFLATGKFDGEMYTYKRCDRCSELLEHINQTIELDLIKAKYCRISDRLDPYYDNLHPLVRKDYGFYSQYYYLPQNSAIAN